jgi:hypothetical protein
MALIFAFVLISWFGWLYPLVPKTPVGWVVAVLSGVVVFFYGWACIEAIIWLQARRRLKILFNSIGALVALSLGCGVFAAAYWAREFVSGNFSYFGR